MKTKRLAGAALLCLAGCGGPAVVSDGNRVGVVTKLSNKQIGWSSGCWNYEGEMSLLGGTKAAGQGGEDQSPTSVWAFSITQGPEKQQIINTIREGMDNGHRLRLHYNQLNSWSRDSCKSDTDYIIIDARDVDATP
jgi:hypothetical protein